MIPNKIYIPLYPNLDTDGFHLGDDWMEKPDSYSKCEHVEYIRKDALLEWLKEKISDYWADGENEWGIYPYALEEVISKLNEEVHVQDTVDNVVPVGNAMCKI